MKRHLGNKLGKAIDYKRFGVQNMKILPLVLGKKIFKVFTKMPYIKPTRVHGANPSLARQ